MIKKRTILVVCVVTLLILTAIVVVFVVKTGSVPTYSQTWQITAKLNKLIVVNGEPVIVQVYVRNTSTKPSFYTDTDQDRQFVLIVKNSRNEIMPLTRYGTTLAPRSSAQANRAIVNILKPNQVSTYRVLVNSRYDMTEMGAYSVIVKRDFGTPSSTVGNEAVSNAVTVLNGGNTNL